MVPASALLGACDGGNPGGESLSCPEGAAVVGGKCVAFDGACGLGQLKDDKGGCATALSCAEGTKRDGDRCVPDGSVICGSGTVYNAQRGACDVAPDACPAGQVRIMGVCTAANARPAPDVREGAEPNGAGETASLVGLAPLTEGETRTLAGCFQGRDIDGDATVDGDFDSWIVQTDAPALLEVRVLGEGKAAGGFVLQGNEQALVRDNFLRFGVNLVGAEVQRSLFLPMAGQYVFSVVDSRALAGLGSVKTQVGDCYWVELTRRALPTPTPLTSGELVGALDRPTFYTHTATDQQVLEPSVRTNDELAVPALVALVDGAYVTSVARDALGDTRIALGSLVANSQVTLVVDTLRDAALESATYQFLGGVHQVVAAAQQNVLTHRGGEAAWLSFSAAAGDIVHLELEGPGAGLTVEVLDGSAARLGMVCGVTEAASPCASADEFLRVGKSGAYYLKVYNLDASEGEMYTLNTRLTAQTPTALRTGEAADGAFDASAGARFYTFDAAQAVWLDYAFTAATGFASGPVLRLYGGEGAGLLGRSVPRLRENPNPAEQATRYFYDGLGPTLLVQVSDGPGAAPEAQATFGLRVSELPFEDLGVLDPTQPLALGTRTLSEDSPLRFVLRGVEGQTLALSATPTDAALPLAVRFTSDYQIQDYVLPRAGEPTVFATPLPYDAPRYALVELVAFRGADGERQGGELNLKAFVSEQAPYLRGAEARPFSSVCPDQGGDGAVHPMRDDGSLFGRWDEGLSAVPLDVRAMGLRLFGEPVTELTISTNGWLTTEVGYTGDARRSQAGSNWLPATVAPLWADFHGVTVCTHQLEDRWVVEWSGSLRSLPGVGALEHSLRTRVQVALGADGSIRFHYASPELAQFLAGALFNPKTETSGEPNAFVLSLPLDPTRAEDTAVYTVPEVQIPTASHDDDAPAVACEGRPADGSCVTGDRCASYHDLKEGQLDVVRHECGANGGAFRLEACPFGYGYCPVESDVSKVHLWTKDVTVCPDGAAACASAGPAVMGEPDHNDAGDPQDSDEDHDTEGTGQLSCERPESLGFCQLSNTCFEVYAPDKLAAVKAACTGTWTDAQSCRAGLVYCVGPADGGIAARGLHVARSAPCKEDALQCISK